MDSAAAHSPRERASSTTCAASVDLPLPCTPLIASTGVDALLVSASSNAWETSACEKRRGEKLCGTGDMAPQ
ncbi:hypothetical protein D3C81_1820090 [compost metagenome]